MPGLDYYWDQIWDNTIKNSSLRKILVWLCRKATVRYGGGEMKYQANAPREVLLEVLDQLHPSPSRPRTDIANDLKNNPCCFHEHPSKEVQGTLENVLS